MGLIFGLLKRIFKLLIYFSIFVAIVLVIPNLPPYTKFTEIKVAQTQSRTGVLSPNEALNNAQKLSTDKIIGPEAFRIFNGELYTGLATGEVVKISPGGHITFVTKIGQPCTGYLQEHICGRPLGLDIDEKNSVLYVADAYYGIWKVDLKTDKKQLLVSPNADIDGKEVKLFNGIALDKHGNFYWTHSTSDFDLKDGAMTCLSDPSGRLLYYNSAKNQSEVLLDNLWFANGVVISPDNQFVLVSESNQYQVKKYFINGPKKGKSEVFVDGLPGIPDNLRTLPDGSGVLAALYVVFDEDHPLISQSLASTPLARKFLARLNRMMEIPFEFLNEQFPHVIFEEIIFKLGHFSSLSSILPQMSGVIQLDWNGNIVASYFNTDKSFSTTSDVIVFNDQLYIGSPHSPFIASVQVPPLLKKAFVKVKESNTTPTKQEAKKVQQPKVNSATTNKPVKETVKVAEVKDLPKADKPTIKNIPESSTAHKTSEEKKTKPIKIEADTKPKPVEAKTVKHDAEKKPKPVETKPTKPVETKPIETKPVKQEANTKPKPVETKPVKQEATKPKPVETKPIKQEATKPKPVETKPVKQDANTKPKPVETNVNEQKAETKPESVETKTSKIEKQAKQESVKDKDAREKNTLNSKTSINEKDTGKVTKESTKVDNAQKLNKEPKKLDEKLNNNIKVEPVKVAHVKIPESKEETVKSSAEKPKVQKSKDKNKDPSKNKPIKEQQKHVPDQIPVREDIPSDRVKPSKETLKVIKKSGPVEIPNPN